MNVEKLKRLQAQVRIGGKGTPRRKKKVIHQTAVTDDKKLQSSLKKLSVSTIPGIEEVNIIKDDLTVIHFNNPKAQASLSANTFAVTGHGDTKKIVEMLPEILPQLGQETVMQLRMFANSMSSGGQDKASGASAAAHVSGDNLLSSVMEEDDDVPLLVSDFDEVSKLEASTAAEAGPSLATMQALLATKEGQTWQEVKNSVLVTEPPIVYENPPLGAGKDKNKDTKKSKKQDNKVDAKIEEKPKKETINEKKPQIEKSKVDNKKLVEAKKPAEKSELKSKDVPAKEAKPTKAASKEQPDKQTKKLEDKAKPQIKAEKQGGKEVKIPAKETAAKKEKQSEEMKQIAEDKNNKANKQNIKQNQKSSAAIDKNKQTDVQAVTVIEASSAEPPKTAEVLHKQTMEIPQKVESAKKVDTEKIAKLVEKGVKIEEKKVLETKKATVEQKEPSKELPKESNKTIKETPVETLVAQENLNKIETTKQKPKKEMEQQVKQEIEIKKSETPIQSNEAKKLDSDSKDHQEGVGGKTTKKSKKEAKTIKKEQPLNETCTTEVVKKPAEPSSTPIGTTQKEVPIKTEEKPFEKREVMPIKANESVKTESKESITTPITAPLEPETKDQKHDANKPAESPATAVPACIPVQPIAVIEKKDVIIAEPKAEPVIVQKIEGAVKEAEKSSAAPQIKDSQTLPAEAPKEIALPVKSEEVKKVDKAPAAKDDKLLEKKDSPANITTPIAATPAPDNVPVVEQKVGDIMKVEEKPQTQVAELPVVAAVAPLPVETIQPTTVATPLVPKIEVKAEVTPATTPTAPVQPKVEGKSENKAINPAAVPSQKKSSPAKQLQGKKPAPPTEAGVKQQPQANKAPAVGAAKLEPKKPDNNKAKQASPAKSTAPAAKPAPKTQQQPKASSPAAPAKPAEKSSANVPPKATSPTKVVAPIKAPAKNATTAELAAKTSNTPPKDVATAKAKQVPTPNKPNQPKEESTTMADQTEPAAPAKTN